MRGEYIKKFYKEVEENLDGKYKIVLETKIDFEADWIEYDKVEWKIEDCIIDLVNRLKNDTQLSLEEKIMKLYEFICMHYIYDANVLYFFRRDDSDPNNIKYIAVDWYGRIVGKDWIEKRKNHNRRICYEFSRFYAKAINTLIDDNDEKEAIIVGDVDNLHYVVGLTGKDYSVILDQDDFNSIKDLTRLKLGLTAKGIHILRDESGKFKNVVDEFNKNRPVELAEIENAQEEYGKNKDKIQYFSKVIGALNKYDIDAQGFFEYVRSIIEKEGIKIEKIWKEDTKAEEKRYERCLYFELDGTTYLLDSIDKSLKAVDIEKLDRNLFIFKPEDNEYEYYGG